MSRKNTIEIQLNLQVSHEHNIYPAEPTCLVKHNKGPT